MINTYESSTLSLSLSGGREILREGGWHFNTLSFSDPLNTRRGGYQA